MDRALDPALLRGALGDIENLPSPEELRSSLAEAEVSAFFAQGEDLPASLIETAWVLHQVGTVRPSLQIYEPERQVQANAVAAHIFDLALAQESELGELLIMTFAAQVSSIRGDRTPNATALAARLLRPTASILRSPGQASLEVGCSLLGLVRANTLGLLRRLRAELVGADRTTVASNEGTPLAAAAAVVEGSRLLLRYLANGDDGDLGRAREVFERGANDVAAQRDLDSRWVAAHLLDLADDLGGSSVWAILPPDTPQVVGRAMTLGEPPVLTLWPPQVSLLRDDERSPLRADVRRAVITFPTSAGKTLLTQLVIANHLATVNTPVCVVAPSHSLCREIRQGLDRRLWLLRRSVAEDGPLGDLTTPHAHVVVMTPERLATRLRLNGEELLEEFGLFILDEAHLVGDLSRGWPFETTISRLHQLTLGTSHRMIIVSAALGGTATVRTWLGVDTPPASAGTQWRGPRRLHATYHVQQHGEERVVPAVPPQRLDRHVHEMLGVVSLYVDAGTAVAVRGAPVGNITRFGKKTEKPSVPQQLSLIVNHATSAGSVLTVHARRASAEGLARELAEQRDERQDTQLVRLAEQRLGPDHPLVDILRKGVAYHHAALPIDIKIEIENAVRNREIDVVCATTTLTEGVNLPVRTVVVAERGYYDGNQFVNLIDAPGLMNAAGRAGRAGRETEGWVIVAENPHPSAPRARRALLGLDEYEDVRSRLTTESALGALDSYEALVAETAGVILEDVPDEVDEFLAYCWYLAEASAALDPTTRAESVVDGLRKTLAWQQLPDDTIARWERLAQKLTVTHESTADQRRGRWAQTGTRLSSNLILERVAASSMARAANLTPEQAADPLSVLEVLLDSDNLAILLGMLPERDRRFKRRRYGATQLLDVDIRGLIFDWVGGADLIQLADRYLSGVVGDDGYKFEQMASFLANVCEHHLPWTAGIVLNWLQQETGAELCPALPAHIHYGAPAEASVVLMRAGIRSRRLAVSIGERTVQQGVPELRLRTWLAQLGPVGWRAEFDAAPAEIADLLQFVRNPATNIGQRLLEGLAVAVPCSFHHGARDDGDLVVRYLTTDEDPRPLVVVDDEEEVRGQLDASATHDVSILVDAGFQLMGTPVVDGGHSSLALTLVDE